MREIKFRAWDGETMQKVLYVNFEQQSSDYLKLMQFTGLRDKNGKEIYEGDVLRKPDPPYFKSVGGDIEPDRAALKYHRGGTGYVVSQAWSFAVESIDCGLWAFESPEGDNFISDEIEVIGNIYENPELLREHPQKEGK